MKYRLIVSDIDGTLTESWEDVNETNRKVLKRLTEQGVGFMIATGRSYHSAASILRALDIPCYACLVNGAELFKYPGLELLKTNYLSVEEKNLLIERIEDIGGTGMINNSFADGDKIYYNSRSIKNPLLKEIIDSVVERTVFVKDFITDINEPTTVINTIGTEEEINQIIEVISDYKEQFNILKLKDNFTKKLYWLMVTKKNADKVRGIKIIADKLGIKREEIIAIGDDLNDYEMIKYAGLGIAMENGVAKLKEVANLIAPPCNEDGFGQVLTEIFQL